MDTWDSKLYLNLLHFYSRNLPKYKLSDCDYLTSSRSLFIYVFSVQKCLGFFFFFILHHFDMFYPQYELFYIPTTLTLGPSFLGVTEQK